MDTIINENIVKDSLENDGFVVFKIERSISKTCDFFVSDGKDKYLIEVKTKQIDNMVKQNKSYYKWQKRGRRGTISSILKEANNQLIASDGKDEFFKVIWFFIDPQCEEDFIYDQIKYGLYGIEIILGKDTQYVDKECYYFTSSDFYKYKKIDAVIIQRQQGSNLLVNNYNKRYSSFKETKLYKIYGMYNAIIDPLKYEFEDKCLIADCALDRKNQKNILDYIMDKYGLKNAKNVVLKHLSIWSSVKIKE